ncbi:MAG TPA: response regulator [Rikenellaceae bacterium]|nr:response regulator [Rikenellaceae bacterium]
MKGGDKMSDDINDLTKPKQTESIYKLLLAEDDFANAEYVKLVMRHQNINVIHAKNGSEALDMFKNTPLVDIILMDIKMPIMDGYEATREIRKLNLKIPVIALTAFALDGDREKALNAGCTDYLTKPVSKDILLSVIGSYLAKI